MATRVKPILSVVFQKARRDLSHYDHDNGRWIEKGPPVPVNEYIGSGGHMNADLQKAQIFGFSRKAKLETYRRDPMCYDVRPVLIQLA